MSLVPNELQYTKDHEWARIQSDSATIGVTDHAQRELGDIVFVELPKVGQKVKAGETFGTIEAVKTVAELYAPVTGLVTEINTALGHDAGVINQDPYGKGWIIKVQIQEAPADLLDAAGYQALI
jgi:glycine cleavage system H protein